MNWRHYDATRDREATQRIWFETGWLEKDEAKQKAMEEFVACGHALVAEIYDEPECMVLSVPGAMRYLKEDISMQAVSGVTTSRVGRKQGLASGLTAQLIALGASEGAEISMLGMFDQGFYNQLGFGTGRYMPGLRFDPALLKVKERARPPRRLTPADGEKLHQARLNRTRRHGACNLLPLAVTTAELTWTSNCFGLGYYDGPNGELSHFFMASTDDVESGPYHINWMIWETPKQFHELLALIRNLGDQVRLVTMGEPSGIQLQDFISQPFKHRQITEKGKFEQTGRATAWWQLRMNDIPGCLAKTHLPFGSARFNLRLTDPIERYLESGAGWRGASGDYVVTLGQDSYAERGEDRTLPTLTTTVNAFSRLWLGVRPATGLCISDDLTGPQELLEQLDDLLRLPPADFDWDF